GQSWDGNDAKDFVCQGQAFENQNVPLKPRTDSQRTRMIRSSRWGRAIDVELTNVPSGTYQVFLYVWEDNDATQFKVLLNDQVVIGQHDSRGAGLWEKLGPWTVKATDGRIKVSSQGGDANLSGLEVWSGIGPVPKPSASMTLAVTPTAEQLKFFESKIRPLLSQHCYACHSADAKEIGGNLRLDSRAAIVQGGDTEPPILPDDPEASLLLTAVRYTDDTLKMPPKTKLSGAEIADLEAWVRMGAPDPRTETKPVAKSKYAIDWEQARQFWAFQPVQKVSPPAVQNLSWPINDIDRFILEKLERAQLPPADLADRPTLIRRATFDLTGLPPSPEEIDAFVNDSSPDAFAVVVDRLLASPQYGERWGRYWLDVVRYADTAGDNSDFPIPQMSKYRDWVIGAFNRDLPYDQFVREQLAGDLMPSADERQRQERIIATGYVANARRFGSRVSDYPQHLTIEDTIDNVGRAFLGLTVNCARCHDHKFDPISAQDYYALYGIFQSTRYPWPGIELEQKQRDLVPLGSKAEIESAQQAKRERQVQLDAETKRLEQARDSQKGDERAKLEKAVQAARNAAEANARQPLPFELAYAIADSAKIEDVRIQVKGDPNKTGPVVHRHFLTILGGAELPAEDHSSGRLQLADWIVDAKNPLTARVLVNRVWHYHFGRGLVSTPNDFGRQGQPPTHPELLDWLANQFVASGWSIKSLHRLIMLSRTYQQASRNPAVPLDPTQSHLLSVFPRRRLDAEAIRDTLLMLSGNLDSKPAGPHPFPPQSEWKFTQHNPFKAVYDTNHRSVYMMTQRIQRHPYLAIFDGADPSTSTGKRSTSTTPLQALYLLNDPFVHEQSRGFAARLIRDRNDDVSRLKRAYLLALSQSPNSDELAASETFLKTVRTELQAAGIAADQLEQQTWQALTRTLFRLNEFVYVD
ncbi:MAG: Planctomycete cytochrome, partial [Planctomycetaceae bacterium]|nr:Planctomycete cytochrome [Planctomycetaceae bacterium]